MVQSVVDAPLKKFHFITYKINNVTRLLPSRGWLSEIFWEKPVCLNCLALKNRFSCQFSNFLWLSRQFWA